MYNPEEKFIQLNSSYHVRLLCTFQSPTLQEKIIWGQFQVLTRHFLICISEKNLSQFPERSSHHGEVKAKVTYSFIINIFLIE